MANFIDIKGLRFGRLLVLERTDIEPYRPWLCLCDCGREVTILSASLRTGRTVSCGCYNKEHTAIRSTKHGKHNSRAYHAWESMKRRCRPNDPGSKNYYGRGITICPRWQTFENFYSDMGDCPDGLSLDRINNNGNYEPGNCRWATNHEQHNNKRTNKFFQHQGQQYTIAELARKYGINRGTLYYRLLKTDDVDAAIKGVRL